jgi:two-component system, OmpR family, phosphate regulon sensor histidine kinase PhoR
VSFGLRAPSEWLDRSTWLFVLLVLVMLLPAACVLWFLNEAVTTQSAAARQRVLEAYRGQLRLVRARIDAHWRAQATSLNGTGNFEQQFARMVLDEVAEGIVFLQPDGTVAYPDWGAHRGPNVEVIEQRLSSMERSGRPDREQVSGVAARLNDYALQLTGHERLTLMTRLRKLAPNVSLPTEAALRLSMDLIDAERPVSSPGGLRETALRDVWALTSEDGQVVALYRTGRLEATMHDFLHQVTPAGIVFIAYPPDVMGGSEAIAAGPWMPGWQLSFQPLDMTPFDAAARRQVIVYISVAVGGIAVMAIVGAAAGRTLRRQMRLARLKTDLVAAVSHELRTPLASMRVLVDGLLADDNLDVTKTREYLQMVAGENERLSRLIENFLAFSRLERDHYRFVFTEVDPSAVIAAAMSTIRDRLPASCDISVEVAPALPALMADADALVTALVNLVDNALKYTAADKQIVVRVCREGDAFISFLVQDNGIGIPVREQRRIFKRFYRVDQRLTQDTGGVGLGLSIVDLIARGHRGSVIVRSSPGAGSTFVLRVPCLDRAAA